MAFARTAQNKKVSHLLACPTGFILFCEQMWLGGVFKFMKNDYFLVFLAVGPFPQDFGQVKR